MAKVLITLLFILSFIFVNGCGFHYLTLSYTDNQSGITATANFSQNNCGLAIAKHSTNR